MQVAVVGANGGIGRRVVARLADAGHDPVGVVRERAQFDAVRERGGEPRLGDLTGEFAGALGGADAVVFTAGSGGETGFDATLLVDLWGARRVVDACVERGVDRFVMVSSLGASDPLAGPEALGPYLVAKRMADDYLAASPVDATILRPTALTDDAGTGRVFATTDTDEAGADEIPREDVAAAIVAALEAPPTVDEPLRLFGGETPVERAIRPEK
ncbi:MULTISPECIES: SDR family oxidoreductase [Halobacterium]|uniref:SDR family oxidoreductase n=1 Tax=Halobacterium TaxID=2239 RepID=UPI00073F19BF|nr:SDR family oxidoreductase [Halobacterium sp. CBA1132]MCG1002044.1 SDR family oxidoreductase [Halobacterium noricense]